MFHEKYYQAFLDNNRYPRELKTYDFIREESPAYLIDRGKKLINFSSSDYLGLSRHPLLISRSQAYAAHYGVGATASRLITGNIEIFPPIESKLAQAIGKPAAVIVGTGYQTNISVLEAILDPAVLGGKARVFCDHACHSSLLTGVRPFSQLQRFRHQDLNHLNRLLESAAHDSQPIFVVVESVYSMDGSKTDLKELIRLVKRYGAFLYVDDAHAVGVYGRKGFGLAADEAKEIDMIMGTFSKALGSLGGYIACSSVMKQYLVNKCKGIIYSTALSPAILGAIDAAIELLPSLHAERERVLRYGQILRDGLKTLGLDYGTSTTHIVSWIIGDAEKTCLASQLLTQEGVLCVAIRPPTVPIKTSRVRFGLTAAHTMQDIEYLLGAIRAVYPKVE